MPRDFRSTEARERHRAGSRAGGTVSAARRRLKAEEGIAFARGWRAGFDAARALPKETIDA